MNNEIKVLVATATLAWGVNLPAHLVIVKGTEYFDGKSSRYVDYPLTDVLQMIGRAGRPGFSDEGRAVVMAQESKKNFYMVGPDSGFCHFVGWVSNVLSIPPPEILV